MNKEKVKNDLLAALPLTITTIVLFGLSMLMMHSAGQLKEKQQQSIVKEFIKGR